MKEGYVLRYQQKGNNGVLIEVNPRDLFRKVHCFQGIKIKSTADENLVNTLSQFSSVTMQLHHDVTNKSYLTVKSRAISLLQYTFLFYLLSLVESIVLCSDPSHAKKLRVCEDFKTN